MKASIEWCRGFGVGLLIGGGSCLVIGMMAMLIFLNV